MNKLVALFIVLILASALLPSSATAAADVFPAGTTGYDISWPQCSGPFPASQYSYGIVGATGGLPFTHNPCLSQQYIWAAASGHPPSLYMNLKSPVGTSAEEALSGPKGACQPNDQACLAYNFGYKSAQDAVAYAKSQSATAASWWLDVETTNTWSGATAMNAIVIGAAIDFLKSQVATVGIYSSPSQWQTIAGSYSPGLTVWTSTAPDAAAAPAFCSRPFGGGEVQLVQYLAGGFDANYACTAADRIPPPPTPTAPVGPPGAPALVAADGDCLNLRAEAALAGAIRACIATGTQVTLLTEAVMADGMRWQQVSSSEVTGWVASQYLRLGLVPPPTPDPRIGTFSVVPTFSASGEALVVYQGGTVDQLKTAAVAVSASGVWVQDASGTYQLLILDGPAFLADGFKAKFPAGLGIVTVTLTRA